MAFRFHLDENVSRALARGLRERGIDVTTTAESGLRGVSDRHQLAFALAESRVLVTHDDDFLNIHAIGVRHAGVVYSRRSDRTLGDLIRSLVLIAEIMEPEDMRDHIEFI